MTFNEYWINLRGFDDPCGKDAARECWNAALDEAIVIAENGFRRGKDGDEIADDIRKVRR